MERRQRPMTAQPSQVVVKVEQQRVPTPRIQSALDAAEEALHHVQSNSNSLATALNGTPVRSRTAVERTVVERAALSVPRGDGRPGSAALSRGSVVDSQHQHQVAELVPVSSAACEDAASAVGPRELLRIRSRLQSTSPWAIHTGNMAKEAASSQELEKQRRQQLDKTWVDWLDQEVTRRKVEQANERERRLQQERRAAEVISLLERRRTAQVDEYKRSIQDSQRQLFEAQQERERKQDEARRLQIDTELRRAQELARAEALKQQKEEEEKRLARVSCAKESMKMAIERRQQESQRGGGGGMHSSSFTKYPPSPSSSSTAVGFGNEGRGQNLPTCGNDYTAYLDRKRYEFDVTLRRRRDHVARRAKSALPMRPVSRQEQLQSKCEEAAVATAILDTKIDREIRQREKAALDQSRVQLRLELERQATEKRMAKQRQRQADLADEQSLIERDRRDKMTFEHTLVQLRKEQKRAIGEQLQLQMLQSLSATISAAAAGD